MTRYTHGHHDSVLRSHRWRTAENSCGYLLPHLNPDAQVLDVGCGPGTITVDLARRVPHGTVIGIDAAASIVDEARVYAEESDVGNLTFEQADVYALPYRDHHFDVVHAHQVLQHVSDPVAALREMHRVTKPGGIVAARDSDYGAMTWFPAHDGLDAWRDLYRRVARANDGEPDAGRMLHAWARQAGFAHVTRTSSNWTYATADEIEWWTDLWSERTLRSAFADSAFAAGVTSQDLTAASDAWLDWGGHDDAWFMVPSGEILCRT